MSVVVPLKPRKKPATMLSKSPSEKTGQPILPAATDKLVFLDNLKILLTILVILHHAAITYGASGGWFYQEVKQTVLPDSVVLTMFAASNQAFFMGLFFFISGCFVASSLMRKSARQFLMDRTIRLGVPVLLFVLLVYPLTIWVGYYPFTLASFATDFPTLLMDISAAHTGPTWFIEVLLIFSLLALLFKSTLVRLAQQTRIITGMQCLAVGVAIGVVSFLTRLVFPDGYAVMNIQLSYLPQYIFFFFAGVVLGRDGIVRIATSQKILPWLVPSLLLLAGLAIALTILLDTAPFAGGLNPYSVFYSLSQGFQSVAFSIVYLVLFHRIANQSAWLSGKLGLAAYGAFFIHALVLVAITLLIKPIVMTPMLKFLLLGVLGVPVSFACGYLLTRLPGARRVF